MKNFVISPLISLVLLLIGDGIWLSLTHQSIYKKQIGHLFAASTGFIPAILFYIMFSTAIAYFVVLPAYTQGYSLMTVLLSGAFLGLVAYGTYDLVNQATLKNWPLFITVIDICWGMSITALVSMATVVVIRFMN